MYTKVIPRNRLEQRFKNGKNQNYQVMLNLQNHQHAHWKWCQVGRPKILLKLTDKLRKNCKYTYWKWSPGTSQEFTSLWIRLSTSFTKNGSQKVIVWKNFGCQTCEKGVEIDSLQKVHEIQQKVWLLTYTKLECITCDKNIWLKSNKNQPTHWKRNK